MRNLTKWTLTAALVAAIFGTAGCSVPTATSTAGAQGSDSSAQKAPAGTTSQQQAYGAAQDYLATQAFSKAGLIKQLSSKAGSGFSVADATWAVNHVKVNWKEQAVKAGKEYLATQAFSKAGLIKQLSSKAGSGFSVAEATWAVNHLKVDWKEQAVKAGKEYLDTQHFSRAGLIQQLSSPYGSQFTKAEAAYAADKLGLT